MVLDASVNMAWCQQRREAVLLAVLLVVGTVTPARSQLYVTEDLQTDVSGRHPDGPEVSSPLPAPVPSSERPESSSTSPPPGRASGDWSGLDARLDRLQLLDTRLSQMDVLDKMFQFVQLDTNVARISAQVDLLAERLAGHGVADPHSSGLRRDPEEPSAFDVRLSALEKALEGVSSKVEGVASRVDSQLDRLQRQVDRLLEHNVKHYAKTEDMSQEVAQLLKESDIVDDHLEQTDNNLKYLRDVLDEVKKTSHTIHQQQHKSETALKEEVKSRVGSAETVLKGLLFSSYTDVSVIRAMLEALQKSVVERRREDKTAEERVTTATTGAPPARHERESYEDDYDEYREHAEERQHGLSDPELRDRLVGEIRSAVAADTKELVTAAARETDRALSRLHGSVNATLEFAVSAVRRPSDCSQLPQRTGGSGVFTIYPSTCSSARQMQVYCDKETSGGGWTVIQRRGQFADRSPLDFFRDWNTYKWGFGNMSEEFYLGNELINLLTRSDDFVLRVELEDFSGDKRYAEYEHFSIDGESDQYKLHVGQYTGNAGDALSFHDGVGFTTKDREHDTWPGKNCATHYRGGWWFANCHRANLNGVYLSGHHSDYGNGVIWYPWRGFTYSLKSSRMMVRPRRVHSDIPDGQR